jgi:predicted dinucleotide-binding enzyme
VIAVLGSGRVGGALAAGLTKAGQEVIVGSRSGVDHATAISGADVVINATPGESSLELLAGLRAELDGKILIDVANATRRTSDGGPGELVYPGGSLAELLQEALPGTPVVKTLNTMLFPVMTNPRMLTVPPTAFLSGDDLAAKGAVRGLLGELGWPEEWIQDLGPLSTARATEATILLTTAVLKVRGLVPLALTVA